MTSPWATPFASLPEGERVAVASTDGASLPLYRVGGPARAPGLLVGHANGFAAGSYGPWLRELANFFRVFAFDARGHGGSVWPAGPLERVFSIDIFAADLARLAAETRARLGDAPLHFAGHSLSAAAALRLALTGAAFPFEKTILFEPPIFPPPGSPHRAEAVAQQEKLIRGSLRRQRQWQSPLTFEAFLRERGVFRSFEPTLLQAHSEAALRPEGDHYALCCPPEVESFIFASHRDADTWGRLSSLKLNVHLVSGDPAKPEPDWVTGAMASIAQEIRAATLEIVPGTGHMMIFQQPARCAVLLRQQAGL